MTIVRTVFAVTGLACGVAQAQSIPFLPVLDASAEAVYQDGRSQTGIQKDVARAIADPSLSILLSDPEDHGPIAACFAEGSNPTPEQLMAVQMAIQGFDSRYQIGGLRWGSGTNSPTTVYWSFVPDGLSIPSGVGEPVANSDLFARMDSLFSGSGGRAVWVAKIQQCFDRWAQVQGINYIRVTTGGNDWDDGASWGTGGTAGLRGDVRIGMKNIDGGSNILAYNAFPTGGDMVIDRSETWQSSANDFRFLRNTVMHEHGHGIGLSHSCPGNGSKLMEPLLATGFDGPQQDDIRGAMWHYGDIYEPNNSSGAAYDLGSLPNGTSTTLGNITNSPGNAASLSLAGDTDQDWFRLTLDIPRLVNVQALAIGSTYLAGPQNANGSCSAGTNTNALAAGDLQIEAYAANGTTQYYLGNATAAGLTESVTALMLPQGNNFIKISDVGTMTITQLYKLSVTPRTDVITPTATDGTFTDKVRITWPIIPSATDYQLYRNTANTIAGATQVYAGTGLQHDDTTAVPGTPYYYYLRVEQFNNSSYRYTSASGNGEQGTRGIPPNSPPTANAGTDQTVTDTDNSGTEQVTLSGAGSTDTDGTIVSYLWQEGVTNLAPASGNPTLNYAFPVGTHTITLTVTDNGGAPDTDTVVITVNAGGGPNCNPIDFNGDGLYPDTADIDDFLSVFSGGPCSTGTCGDVDFNNDGLFPDTLDIDSLLSVFSGGPCL